MNIIEEIKEFAISKHNNPNEAQRYGNKPYSVHLEMVVEVAKRYLYLLPEETHCDVICACFAHDLLEDTDVSHNDLKSKFNERIADIVFRVTNERGLSRKEVNFKTYPKIWQSDLATYVKLSDRISNGLNSKNGDSDKSKSMFKRYVSEYPIFRYALKSKLYGDMWKELDEIFNYK